MEMLMGGVGSGDYGGGYKVIPLPLQFVYIRTKVFIVYA
jgi:hypothetical protein